MDVVVNQIVQLGLNTACNRSRSDLDPVTKRNTLDFLRKVLDDVRGFCFFYFWAESGHWESLAFCPNNDDYLEEARRVISAWMKERTFQEGPSRIKTEFI